MAPPIRFDSRRLNPNNPVEGARIDSFLTSGQVIACAAESVWGLSCDAENPKAVAQLRRMKNRTEEKGFILVTGHLRHMNFLLSALPKKTQQAIDKYWPGYTTLLIPDPEHRIPPWIKGDSNHVAVRLTQHPPLVSLSTLWDSFLVSSSANPTGQTPAINSDEVRTYFGGDIPLLWGDTGKHSAVSPIIHLETGKRLR